MIFKIGVLVAVTKGVLLKRCSYKFRKIHRKTAVPESRVSFLIKLEASGKETLAQVFSCEFCEIYKNTFYYRTPLVAASGVLINFAILEPFSNKVAGLFNRIPMVAPSDFSLQ